MNEQNRRKVLAILASKQMNAATRIQRRASLEELVRVTQGDRDTILHMLQLNDLDYRHNGYGLTAQSQSRAMRAARIWVTADRKYVRIDKMDQGHLQNAFNMVQRNKDRAWQKVLGDEITRRWERDFKAFKEASAAGLSGPIGFIDVFGESDSEPPRQRYEVRVSGLSHIVFDRTQDREVFRSRHPSKTVREEHCRDVAKSMNRTEPLPVDYSKAEKDLLRSLIGPPLNLSKLLSVDLEGPGGMDIGTAVFFDHQTGRYEPFNLEKRKPQVTYTPEQQAVRSIMSSKAALYPKICASHGTALIDRMIDEGLLKKIAPLPFGSASILRVTTKGKLLMHPSKVSMREALAEVEIQHHKNLGQTTIKVPKGSKLRGTIGNDVSVDYEATPEDIVIEIQEPRSR